MNRARWEVVLLVALAAVAASVVVVQGRIAGPTDASDGDAPAGTPFVTYALCKHNLDSLQVLAPLRPDDRFAIVAQLDSAATKDLERITDQNIGGVLEVVIGEWLFVRGPIRMRLRSGLITNTAFETREEAETWLRELHKALPERACGLE